MKQLTTPIKITLLALLAGLGLFSILYVRQVVHKSPTEVAVEEPTENEDLVRRLYDDILNTGDLDQADALIAANYIDHNPLGVARTPGLVGFKQAFRIFRVAFPDQHYTVEEIIVKADKVVCRFTMRGTHRGTFMGITSTEKKVQATGIDIFRIAEGKIVEHWGGFDRLGLMQQLGVIHRRARQDKPSSSLTDLNDFAQLKNLFKRDTGTVRLVALLSPN
jgi:steroid delta-isomerase-like uncharacterized protein